MKEIEELIIDFVYNFDINKIKDRHIRIIKKMLLDAIGCGIAGFKAPDTQYLLRCLKNVKSPGKATVFVAGDKYSSIDASLANSLMIRVYDFNDSYWRNDPSHPSDIIPVVIALGEEMEVTGKEFLFHLILAYEIVMRFSDAFYPSLYSIGWHPSTFMKIASALAAAKMLDLNYREMMNALNLASSNCLVFSGISIHGKLSMMKNLADPLSVSQGILCALLAKEGVSAPPNIISGSKGMLETLNVKMNLNEFTKDNLKINLCSIKYYPCEYLIQASIESILKLINKYKINLYSIDEINIKAPKKVIDLLATQEKYRPSNKETADHSLPFCIALAVKYKKIFISHFNESQFKDPVLSNIIDKINIIHNPDFDRKFPDKQPVYIEIITDDGKLYNMYGEDFKGSPSNPLTIKEIENKFQQLAKTVFTNKSKILNIIKTIKKMEDVKHINELTSLLIKD